MRKLRNDLSGRTFGDLYVIGVADDGNRKTSYICECICGNVKKVRGDGLLSGAVKSCGCRKRRTDRENVQKVPSMIKQKERGFRCGNLRIYHIWQNMKARCYNRHDARYSNYGGRGIAVCKEWKDDFINFYEWANKNGYSDDLTIDRIDVNGNYEPSNCRWATIKQQANNRTTNINITIGNTTKNLTEWCDIFQVDYKKTLARYHREENITIDRLFNDILWEKGGDKK